MSGKNENCYFTHKYTETWRSWMAWPGSFKELSTQLWNNLALDLPFLVLAVVCWWWPCVPGMRSLAGLDCRRKQNIHLQHFSPLNTLLGVLGSCKWRTRARSFFKVPQKSPTRTFCEGEDWESGKLNKCRGMGASWAGLLAPPLRTYLLVQLADTVTRP